MKTTILSIHTVVTALFLWICLLVSVDLHAQCNSCTTSLDVTSNPNAIINLPDDDAVFCLTAANTTISPFLGTINITGNNVTLCISSNVRITTSANINFSGTNGIINNFGTFQRNSFTLTNGYSFNNTGRTEIFANLIINTATFTNTGVAIIDGSYTQTDPAQVNISGPTSIGGSVTIDGGDLTITSIIVTVGGGYTQNNGRVSGGNNPLLPGSGCGSLNVSGTSNLSNGIFGFGSGLIGMCDNTGTSTGFDIVNSPPSTVTPNGSIKCDCFQALPVELLYFRGIYASSQVRLNWGTSSEKANLFFTLERSSDGVSFEKINEIPGIGDSHVLHTYQSIDTNPYPELTYYRLKQTDRDGSFTYSDIIAVQTPITVSDVRIFPSPLGVSDALEIRSEATPGETVYIRIYDQLGKKCFEDRYKGKASIRIPVSQFTHTAGLYIVQARKGSQLVHKKVVIH